MVRHFVTACGVVSFAVWIYGQLIGHGELARSSATESKLSGGEEVKNIAPAVVAPVVATKTGVTLAEHLDLANLPLATTPGGKNFVLKALHPSDFTIKTNRGPGGTLPSLGVACDVINTIDVPAAATRCVIFNTPNICIMGSIIFYDAAGNVVDFWNVQNSAFQGSSFTHGPYTSTTQPSFGKKSIQDYRVTAQSVTMESIVPSLYEAGTITSAQFVTSPQTVSSYEAVMASTDISTIAPKADVWVYPLPPDADVMLMGSNAYTSKIQEGFYQPLKLDKFKFVGINDTHIPITRSLNAIGIANGTATACRCFFPYYTDVLQRGSNWPLPKPSCKNVGITYVSINQPSSGTIKLRFRWRQVVEIHPRLGQEYAALSEAPLPPDATAYKMYAEVAQRMKDAYPARYNDENKLKGVINSLAKGLIDYVEPAISLVSSFLPQIRPAAVALRGATGLVKNIMSPQQFQNTVSLKSLTPSYQVVRAGSGTTGPSMHMVAAVRNAANKPQTATSSRGRRRRKQRG